METIMINSKRYTNSQLYNKVLRKYTLSTKNSSIKSISTRLAKEEHRA